MSLPGWDSLAATSLIAKVLTNLGFLALFALGLFEVLGHVYSVHESTLKEAAAARDAEDRRRESDARIVEAQRGAAEATERAQSADATAKRFEAQIADSNARAKSAEAQVATASARAAEANEKAERERLARLQLEARLADRVITEQQRARLRSVFATIKGQTVDVWVFGDNPDVANVSNAILASLESAGVLINMASPAGGAGGVRGVIVGVSPDAASSVKTAAKSVVEILHETLDGGVAMMNFNELQYHGIHTGGSSPGAANPGTAPLRIWIGSK